MESGKLPLPPISQLASASYGADPCILEQWFWTEVVGIFLLDTLKIWLAL